MRGRRGLPCDIEESPCQKPTLIAVPKAGYRFDHWVLDGETSEYQVVTVTMGTEHVNERACGRGIKLSGVDRKEIFVSTKLWPSEQ
ncbi:MAG: hypothetical protein J5812_05685 [Candidatus Methanomethylophilaceae archaeon]|nr:hypothetical protein [Candidatus Methanomethylophilaceae archaeon]